MLMFRSPNERTPDFYAPNITNDGFQIGVKALPKKKKSKLRLNGSFSKQQRFLDYKILSRVTSKQLGPGAYQDFENFKQLRSKPCMSKFSKSSVSYDSNDPCYIYVGNHLMYEPEFSQSFKKPSQMRSSSAFSIKKQRKDCTRLCYSVKEKSNSPEKERKTQTAKIKIRKRKNRFSSNMTNIQKEAVLAMSEEGRSSTRNDRAAENYYSNQAQIRIKSKKSRKNHSKNTQSQIFNQDKRKIALGSLYGKTTMKATVTPKDHLVQAANPKNFENEVTIGHIRIDSKDGSMQINRGNNRSSMMPATNNSTLDNTAVTRAKNDKRSSSINSSYSRKQDKGSSFKVHNDSVVMTEEHKRKETFQITSQEEPLKPTGFKENLPKSKMSNLYLAYGKQSFAEARRSTTKSTKVRPKSTI
ncbi:unnamed protein product [Moneuplotes crassus]|uniref:Uncharacterized protein n=1 Tax=Euplotes crassus TaxID=5936 RepID=A0AAD1US64_EUPCR|nr:unnamed protein product [Moneuplotes crassus]